MKAKEQKIPDLLLEKYILDELSEEDTESIKERVSRDQEIKRRIEALRKSDRLILKQYPVKKTSELIKDRLEQSVAGSETGSMACMFTKRMRFIFQRLIPAMGILVVLFVFLFPSLTRLPISINPLEDNEITRVKGSAKLYIFQKINDKERKLNNNDTVKKGDIVQLGFMAGNNNYGVIFSLDGRKTITLHYPYQAEGSTKLTLGKMKVLDESYELDDAPKYEIFFFIASRNKIDTGTILKKAEAIKDDPEQALQKKSSIFKDYEFMSLKLIKEKTK